MKASGFFLGIVLALNNRWALAVVSWLRGCVYQARGCAGLAPDFFSLDVATTRLLWRLFFATRIDWNNMEFFSYTALGNTASSGLNFDRESSVHSNESDASVKNWLDFLLPRLWQPIFPVLRRSYSVETAHHWAFSSVMSDVRYKRCTFHYFWRPRPNNVTWNTICCVFIHDHFAGFSLNSNRIGWNGWKVMHQIIP